MGCRLGDPVADRADSRSPSVKADGERFSWLRYSHCLVLVGYTAQDYIFQDPLSGLVSYPRADCESSFTALGCQAVILEKAE